MEYPKWAPPELVELHKLEVQPDRVTLAPERAPLLEALISREQMQKVWNRLRKRKANFEKRLTNATSGEPLLLLGPIFDAAWESDLRPSRSSSADYLARHLEAIERIRRSQALSLFEVCAKIRHCFSDLKAWPHQESQDVYKNIQLFADALASLIEYVPWGNSVIDDWEDLLEPEQFTELADSLNIDDDLALKSFFKSAGDVGALAQNPRTAFPALLRKLAEQAGTRVGAPKVIPQPNSTESEQRYFVVELVKYFERAYGTPLYENVADIATVVFDKDIDEDSVTKLIRDRREALTRRNSGREEA